MHLTFPVICVQCGESLVGNAIDGVLTCPNCGEPYRGQPVSPAELERAHSETGTPPDERLEVIESTPDLLVLRLKSIRRSVGTSIIVVMALSLCVTWIGLAFLFWKMIYGASALNPMIVALPVGVIGFLGSILALEVMRGDWEIELTRETLACRRRASLFRNERSLPTNTIECVCVSSDSETVSQGRSICTVYGLQGMLPLTRQHSNAVSHRVADLVRRKLAEWGRSSIHDSD